MDIDQVRSSLARRLGLDIRAGPGFRPTGMWKIPGDSCASKVACGLLDPRVKQ